SQRQLSVRDPPPGVARQQRHAGIISHVLRHVGRQVARIKADHRSLQILPTVIHQSKENSAAFGMGDQVTHDLIPGGFVTHRFIERTNQLPSVHEVPEIKSATSWAWRWVPVLANSAAS